MDETEGNSWADLEDWIVRVYAARDALRVAGQHMSVSTPVFRGQSNAKWGLQTTLERYGEAPTDVIEYYRAISGIQSSIESLTGQRWDVPEEPEFRKTIGESLPFGSTGVPAYEYLVHLRYHGFPTPLLDWSRSPFVAAFFAFNHASDAKGRIAIYAFMEYAGGGKVSSSGQPTIRGLGPHVTTHKRHVLQQAEYTICVQQIEDRWAFVSHDEAILRRDQLDDQDRLWKFTLPAGLREPALRRLDMFNLNAFSLFPSEDSLMETMALRAFAFKKY